MNSEEEDWVDDEDLTFEEVLAIAAKLEAATAEGTGGPAVLPAEEENVLAVLSQVNGRLTAQQALMKNAGPRKIASYAGMGPDGDKGAAMWRIAEAKDRRGTGRGPEVDEFWAFVREELESGRLRQCDIVRAAGVSREAVRLRMLGRRGGRS